MPFAANSFLEGLAAFRRSRGLPAKAIAWGLLRDAGMAVGRDGLIRISDQRGLLTMTALELLYVLPAVLRRRTATSLVARFAAGDRVSRSFGGTEIVGRCAGIDANGARRSRRRGFERRSDKGDPGECARGGAGTS